MTTDNIVKAIDETIERIEDDLSDFKNSLDDHELYRNEYKIAEGQHRKECGWIVERQRERMDDFASDLKYFTSTLKRQTEELYEKREVEK